MNWLKKLRKWPIDKKRILALSIAAFLTILVIVINAAINIIWKDNTPIKKVDNTPFETIGKSFSDIINGFKPAFDQAFGSSTKISGNNIQSTSSSSTTLNVVK